MHRSEFADDRLAELGARIRARRLELGWTQEKLAEHAGERCGSYVSSVERGRANVSFDNLVTIACALQLDVGELVKGIY